MNGQPNVVTLKIDDRDCSANSSQTILEVASENNIDIPTLCCLEGLSGWGGCRLCLVEIKGTPKLLPACVTRVTEGMEVVTNSGRLLGMRQDALKRLLVHHPLDCPICDKAGECLLQDYSYAYGSRETRTREPRRKLAKRKDIGPRMVLDQERCILCRRCVRFCREITHTNELGVFGMGDRSVLDVVENQPLANDYSICTADICPVGALESKDFHHRLRVWFLKKTPSVCPSCSNGCNVTVDHYRDRIWRLMPRRNDAVNGTWMCDHGRLNYQYVDSPNRLRQPLLRRNGQLEPSDWDEAIATAARHLHHIARASGGSSIGAVASPHLTNEENFRFAQVLRTLGVTSVDVAVVTGASDDLLIKAEKAANARGARDMGLGPAAGGLALPAMLEAAASGDIRALYVCGPDLWDTAERELLLRAVERLDCLIVQDIVRSPLAECASVVLPSLTFAEKSGTFTNGAGRVQRLHRAIEALNGQPSDGEIFSRLLNQIGEGRWEFDPDAVLLEIAAAVPAYAGLTAARVGMLGYQLPDAGPGAGQAAAVAGTAS